MLVDEPITIIKPPVVELSSFHYKGPVISRIEFTARKGEGQIGTYKVHFYLEEDYPRALFYYSDSLGSRDMNQGEYEIAKQQMGRYVQEQGLPPESPIAQQVRVLDKIYATKLSHDACW